MYALFCRLVAPSVSASAVPVPDPIPESNMYIASVHNSIPHLAFPPTRGLQAIPAALPSTSSRTTASAVPISISAEVSLGPISISSSLSSQNELIDHIEKHSLGLRERPMIPADGNCWFWSNTDLIKVYGLPAPHDPNELRKAVANSLLKSKHKTNWLKNLFQSKMRKMKKFIKEQSQPGQFIDNNGIMVILTSDYLGVQYHIAGTSNNAQNPVTKLGNETYERVFHIGLYQDTTDQLGLSGRSGHYQSLEPVPGKAVPCCGVDAGQVTVSIPIDRDVTIDLQNTIEEEAIEKVRVEENILKLFKDNKDMVKLSLKRVLEIKNVNTEVLFKTDISNILYTDMRKLYSNQTTEGTLCRKILKRYQDLCKVDPRLRNEELPTISDISEDENDPPKPVRSFRSLFTSDRRSSVLSEMNTESIEISTEPVNTPHLASSTVLSENPEEIESPPLSSVFSRGISIFDACWISFIRSFPHTTTSNTFSTKKEERSTS